MYGLIYTSPPADQTQYDYTGSYDTTTGATGSTTTDTMPTTTTTDGADATNTADVAAEGLTIYAESSMDVGAMNAFQNYGGIGLFVNAGQQFCQSNFYQAPADIGTATK